MPVFQVTLQHTIEVIETATVDVEAPDRETAINYLNHRLDTFQYHPNWDDGDSGEVEFRVESVEELAEGEVDPRHIDLAVPPEWSPE